MTFIGILLSSIFSFLAFIHYYWALGGKWGADVALPASENNIKAMNPGFIACFIVGSGLLGLGIICLENLGLIHLNLPTWITGTSFWIFACVFLVRAIGDFKYVGFTKRVRNTSFARLDTRFYSPLCLAIGILMIILKTSN